MATTLLRPSIDIVFKMLFASAESRDALTDLLEAVLEPQQHIKIAKVLNPEIPKDQVVDKGIILDILVELTDGSLVDVEIQVANTRNIWLRSLYYWARIYGSQLKSGEQYQDLRPTAVIFLLNFEQFRDYPAYSHHIFKLQHQAIPSLVHPHIRLDFVELAKLPSPLRDAAGMPAQDRLSVWQRFLLNPEAEDLQELIMNDSILKKTKEQLERISSDPEAQRLTQLREDARRNYESSISAAKSEGHEEGIKEGIEEGRKEQLRETISRLSTAGFDQNKIAEILQLSKESLLELIQTK